MDNFHAFKYSPIGIGMVSLKGNWMKVNPALCEILGYTEDELLKLTVKDTVASDNTDVDVLHQSALLNNEIKTYEIEIQMRPRLGHLVWLQHNVTLVRDQKGHPLYFLLQIQDITEKKKLKEELLASQSNYRLIAENTNDLIGILDRDLNIVYASPSHQKILGYKTFNGENGCQFFYPEDIPLIISEIERIKRTKRVSRFEVRLVNVKGNVIYTETQVTPIFDENGHFTQIVYVTRDISEKKRANDIIVQSEKLYRVLYEALNFISKETQRLSKKQDLLRMLVGIIGDVFETNKVGLVSIHAEGTVEWEESAPSILLPQKDLYASDQIITIENGFIFTRVAVCDDTKYYIFVKDKEEPCRHGTLLQWLYTVARFAEILTENIQQMEDMLTELNRLVHEKQSPAWLSRLLFKVAEEQRVKLSIDLHDSALQEQIIWYRKLGELIENADLPQPILDELRRIHIGIEEVLHQIRITCNELTPPFLKNLGIIHALQLMIKETHIRLGDYVIDFQYKGTFDQLNEEQILGIYRIVQELLTTAAKHSKASRIQIGLFNEDGRIRLAYQDNGTNNEGRVFYGTTRQVGLYGIQERVRSLDGEISSTSTEQGLKMEMVLPAKVNWMDKPFVNKIY